ncbi:hypothetical protein CWO91_16740 [Bradyrhizobium genosp. SA-3]|uniref:hypothetical protein n=1 Tax=Bradyrhizobium genosp. SA-3 TaxID=508868 RepID=UPI00102A6CEE|nr:hypothetical protein [Bradyrhizobium genosp. SA-3]RZN09675.1 hypothetical protein CWO91_16740 [Bradyrhizobium genosp. SA-3]
MTDEECIATALLHGAKIWPSGQELQERNRRYGGEKGTHPIYVIDRGFHERMPCVYDDLRPAYNEAKTAGEAARAYCIRHNLMR